MQKSKKIDILKQAVSREIESVRFYLALADFFENPNMRKACIDIANEELEHKGLLELEIMKCGHTVANRQDWRNVDQISGDLAEFLSPDMTYKDFLLMAIAKEEEAFRFYIDLLSSVQEKELREVVAAIIEQEVRHKCSLETEYNSISKEK